MGSLYMLDISVSLRVTIKIYRSILGLLDTGRNGSRLIIWAAIWDGCFAFQASIIYPFNSTLNSTLR